MNNFDQQFNNKKVLNYNGHSISYVDILPEVIKNNIPIFIAPGWGETPKTFKGLIYLLSESGFRVISVKHQRHDMKLITANNISRLESQKAEIINLILEKEGIEKINIIAHSEGAINAIMAAHCKSNIFKNILLIGPGGLVDHESFLELSIRFVGNILQGCLRAFYDPIARNYLIRSGIETFKYFLSNPIMGLLEGSAISRTHLQNYLIQLHQNGISIGVIHGIHDIVFPIKKMKNLSELKWITFYPINGDHHDIYASPANYLPLIQKKFNY